MIARNNPCHGWSTPSQERSTTSLSHETHEDSVQWDAAKREVQASVAQEVRRRLSQSPDAAEIERTTQRIAREIFGPIIGAELTARAAELSTGSCRCGQCGARVRMLDKHRGREPTRVMGGSHLERSYFYCDNCKQGYVPADQVLGVGPSAWLPSLERGAGSPRD